MRGLSLVVASGDHSSSRCAGLSPLRPLLVRSTGSRRAGSVIVAHGPSCSVACGIFPDQGSNPCPLHWQADSQPLRHQGSPIPLFIHLLMRPGLLDISLSNSAFTRQKDSSPAPCSSSDHSQCLFQKWRRHLPSDHTSQIHWTCCSFWSPSMSLRIRWRYAMYQTPPKSPRLKVFSLLVLCVPRQSAGRLCRQSLGGGVRGLPVNIRFRLSLRKEGTGRNCALALNACAWKWSQQFCSRFIGQSRSGDRGSPQRWEGVLSVTQGRHGMFVNIFLCVNNFKEWGQIPRVLHFLMTSVSYTIILYLHHQ